jgi:hypothetical protein
MVNQKHRVMRRKRFLQTAVAYAAIELPEKDHPARRVIEEDKRAQRARLVRLSEEVGLREPEMLADELHLLLEGARITAQSIGTEGLAARLLNMGKAMIAAHSPRRRSGRAARQFIPGGGA